MNKKLLIISILSLSLAACKEPPYRSTSEGEAKYYASMVNHEIHAKYLNCYPPNKEDISNAK